MNLPDELVQKIVDYLQTQPYGQVVRLIGEIVKESQGQNGKQKEVKDEVNKK